MESFRTMIGEFQDYDRSVSGLKQESVRTMIGECQDNYRECQDYDKRVSGV